MEQILYIGISQTFFAALFIATRKPRLLANQLLAAWLFLISLEMIMFLINDTLIELYPIKVIPFTYGPLLFLYSRFLTKENPRFRARHLYHFIPFLCFFIFSIIFHNKPVMDGTRGFFREDGFISFRIVYSVAFFISITGYSIGTYVVIHQHQKTIQSFLSYRSGRVTLQWLIVLSVIFYLGYVLMFIFGGIDLLVGFMPFDPYEISFIGLILFAFIYGFFGYEQPSIFREIVRDEQISIPPAQDEGKKYTRSGLKRKDAEKYRNMILTYMEKEKPYLDREMTIHDMSRDLKIPRHFITEVINEHMGKNFYTLINEYRVQEVQRRMVDPAYRNFTILAIAFDSGFNSKSAFNTIFKNLCGKTPSEYKDELGSGNPLNENPAD
ncbi:MAG: helix-turn-helix domain-containing protein [Bacteroidota bacterium]